MEAKVATVPQVQGIAMAADMEAQVEDMEAGIHTVAAKRAPHMAAMEAARTLTAAMAVEAATAKESLPMEAVAMALTALSQALVAMAPPEPEDHHILVVTATAAMERAPLHSTEAKERALAMALLHPMVAMEAPHQDMARIPATERPLAMVTPHRATARPQATVRAQATARTLVTVAPL